MKIRSLLLTFALLGTNFVGMSPASALSVNAGSLIKGPTQSDVYYYGPDGKRYAFPNEKTYFSWYTDFSTVQTISASELASLPLGGLVTYRPGVTMVKLTTDPKVYAVAARGTLRWVQTGDIAVSLYGNNWAQKIHDLPEAFFTSYTLGSPIGPGLEDYNPISVMNIATTIAVDKGLQAPSPYAPSPSPSPSPTSTSPTPPTSTSTLSVNFTVSKTKIRAGDFETLTVSASHPSGIARIDMYLDENLTQTCYTTPSCTGDIQIPQSGTKPEYTAKAIVKAMNGETQTKTILVTVDNSAGALVRLTITRAIITSAQVGEATIDSDISLNVLRTDIYIDGASIKACATNARQCRWSGTLPGQVGTVYSVYGIVTDTLGRLYKTDTQTITIGTNDSPIINILTDRNSVNAGGNVEVSVSASDDQGIQNISILKDSVLVKTCQGSMPCTAVIGPLNTPGTVSLQGQATDGMGLSATSSPYIITVN